MATFGKTSNGIDSVADTAEQKRVSKATPSVNGTLTKITARVWYQSFGGAATSMNAKAVIYSDNAGEPNALLAVSDEVTVNNSSEQEIDFPFSGENQIEVISGTDYWIGCHNDSASILAHQIKA